MLSERDKFGRYTAAGAWVTRKKLVPVDQSSGAVRDDLLAEAWAWVLARHGRIRAIGRRVMACTGNQLGQAIDDLIMDIVEQYPTFRTRVAEARAPEKMANFWIGLRARAIARAWANRRIKGAANRPDTFSSDLPLFDSDDGPNVESRISNAESGTSNVELEPEQEAWVESALSTRTFYAVFYYASDADRRSIKSAHTALKADTLTPAHRRELREIGYRTTGSVFCGWSDSPVRPAMALLADAFEPMSTEAIREAVAPHVEPAKLSALLLKAGAIRVGDGDSAVWIAP